jgi:hypothetical protein
MQGRRALVMRDAKKHHNGALRFCAENPSRLG